MWLICPTLYWARHSSKVATQKEEEKKCLWSLFPEGWMGMVAFIAAAEATARLCLVHPRELWGCSTPAPPTKPNSSTQVLAPAEFPGSVLCFGVPWHHGSGSAMQRLAGPQLLLKTEKQEWGAALTDVRQLMGPPRSHLLQWVRRNHQEPLVLPLLWHLKGCSDCSAWCSG